MEQPFVITYTYNPHKDAPGNGAKHRSFEYYGDALARFRQLIALPELYSDVKANFETDDDVIAEIEVNQELPLNPKTIIR